MTENIPPISRRQALSSLASATAAIALMPPVAAASPAVMPSGPNGASWAPEPLASLADFEKAAREKMTPMAYEYVSGGAGDEHTLAWNQSAYQEIKLRSRVLADVSRIDTSVRLFGVEL